MKKLIAMLLALAMVLSLAACGASTPAPTEDPKAETPAPEAPKTEEPKEETPAEPIPLTFWYSLGGTSGEAVQALVERFNASQDKYVMTAEYQGTYNDSLLKFLSSPDEQRPDVIMVNELGTQKIMDSKAYTPIQNFIDSGDLDISDYLQNVMNAYMDDNGMFAFPFSITVPAITYNVEALEKAGVNPETDLVTFEGFKEACQKLVDSGVVKYGACIVNDAWHVEQMVAMASTYLTDNENGRSGRVTKLTSAEDGSLLKTLNVLRDFYIQDYSYTEANNGDARAEFCAGNVGMIITTAGNYGTMKDTAAGLFTLGQTTMPTYDGANNVPYPSGAALWIVDRGADEKEAGVVEFVKFFATAEQQANFALATGYLPINEAVMENPEYKNFVENVNPGLQKIIGQLRVADRRAAIFGVDDKFRSTLQSEISTMRADHTYTAEQALKVIADTTNEEIELYNLTVE